MSGIRKRVYFGMKLLKRGHLEVGPKGDSADGEEREDAWDEAEDLEGIGEGENTDTYVRQW
jgi:hypothetical protein